MTSRGRATTPTTPFIPPFGSPRSSNGEPAPVIPGGSGGGHSPAWNQPQTIGGYPVMSPYLNGPPPFIPSFSPGGTTPGVIPSALPASVSRSSSRGQGLSADYTGYPQGTPATSPTHLGMYGGHTSTPAPGPAPTPAHHHPYASQPTSPWFAPPAAVAWGGTPFAPNAAALPGTPWGHPAAAGGGGGPPPLVAAPPAGHYVPFGMPPMATPAWPGAGMFTAPMAGIPLPPAGGGRGGAGLGVMGGMGGAAAAAAAADPWAALYGGAPAAPPARPAPPAQAHDKLDPFLAGKHYGPVLDPFLIRVVGAQVKINPLISALTEDSDSGPHLRWNMLFPASTIQRSDEPHYMSWSKGRDTPATFPRVTTLRLLFASSPNEASSAIHPWLVDVRASDRDSGVTCGEVMDALASSLARFTVREDYDSLSQKEKREVGLAYKHNRSRAPDVPGGALGEGMKRLDFLKTSTMFNGVENDEKVVKRLLGTVMPCVFVVRTATRLPMTRQEIRDQEARSRNASRSRANSVNARVTVQAPSSTSDESDDSDRGGGRKR